jgi:hypothetical protein
MEGYLISFAVGFISALIITFITHFLSIKRFKSATIYGEKIKHYSNIIPILKSPKEVSLPTEEVCSIFNTSILVSNSKISQELLTFLENFKDVRLGKGIFIPKRKLSKKEIRRNKKNTPNTLEELSQIPIILEEGWYKDEATISNYFKNEGERIIKIIHKNVKLY